MGVSSDVWHDLLTPPERLQLAPTLLSGMSFRWQRCGDCTDTFVGVLDDHAFELKQAAHTCYYRALGPASETAQGAALLRKHLSLDRGVDVRDWMQRATAAPPLFAKAAAALQGVRVLHISHLEALVTFVGSANNNIKRNMQMVEALCAHFGDATHIASRGSGESRTRLHRFPSVAQLASLSEAELWQLGWGYRAPRVVKLAQQLVERGGEAFLEEIGTLSEDDARAALCELCGVGRKVADCVLLFSYGHDGCVPVDTHCFQIAERCLLPAVRGLSLTPGVYQRIVERFHALFGREHAGWAFMVCAVRVRGVRVLRAAARASATTQAVYRCVSVGGDHSRAGPWSREPHGTGRPVVPAC